MIVLNNTIVRTLIIHPYLKSQQRLSGYDLDYQIEEAQGLAKVLDLQLVHIEQVPLNHLIPATFIGKGKVEECAQLIKEQEIELVIINDNIAPVQQRNLEKELNAKVIDRTALILEIFAKRAQTKEGRLQVELARQEYLKSRLVRSWTHLERQRGGAGFLGGPGETQIEADRRGIADRIDQIKRQLRKVVTRRELHRTARRKVPYPIVALVGYTNAGKSTLFNQLTKAGVLAEDKLFATLDPTMRMLKLPSGKKIILSDTVGFISDLPTQLVAAFRATLEEVMEADLLLHIRDITHTQTEEQKKDVLEILKSLVEEEKIQHDMLEVLNKVDKLESVNSEVLAHLPKSSIAISALKGTGVTHLLEVIDEHVSAHDTIHEITLGVENGKALSWIYAHSKVLERKDDELEVHITCAMAERDWGNYQKLFM